MIGLNNIYSYISRNTGLYRYKRHKIFFIPFEIQVLGDTNNHGPLPEPVFKPVYELDIYRAISFTFSIKGFPTVK